MINSAKVITKLTGSLGHEEPRKHNHDEAKGAVNEVRPKPALAKRGKHAWCSFGDNKVEEPLARCRHTHHDGAEAGWWDFGAIGPNDRAPSELIRGSEDVDGY